MTVLENGTMQIEVIKDMTQLNEQEAVEGMDPKSEEDICEEASIKEKFAIGTEECEVSEDGNIVSVRGEKELSNEKFQTENGYFRFYYTEEQDKAMTAEGIGMIKSAGVSMLINIEMPGEIVAVNAGGFLGNLVRIDMLREAEKNGEKDLEFIVISKSMSATGEIPWEITEEFITEAGLKEEAPSEGVVAPFAVMQGMMEGMAEAMKGGAQEESFKNNAPEVFQKASDTREEKLSVYKTVSLPASGATGILTSIWLWITSLF